MALKLTSPKFINGGVFPSTFTCNGKNVSPPLVISGVPKKAKTLVLIFDDPDAAKEPAGDGTTFDHWIVYNIPAVDQDVLENSIPKGEIWAKIALAAVHTRGHAHQPLNISIFSDYWP